VVVGVLVSRRSSDPSVDLGWQKAF
jgi:hypothetical protein